MIKQLFIVRHGKAISDYNNISDFDRPLKEKGILDSYKIAKNLLDKNLIPEIILSSTAVRAMHTATIFAKVFDLNPSKIILNSNLYLANPDILMDIICKTETKINSLAVIGHNPGLSETASYLTGNMINLPTTGLVGIRYDIQFWPEIINIRPLDTFIDSPKSL